MAVPQRREQIMIKKTVFIIFILLLCINIFSEEIERIPRRILFIQENHNAVITENLTGIINGISNFLYNSISSIIPIVRVYDAERANSIIMVDIFEEEESFKIIITLSEENNELMIKEFSYPKYREEYEGFSLFINNTAEDFSEYLGFVLPKVESTDIFKEEQYEDISEETEYLDSLAKNWELTLWTSGMMQTVNMGGGESEGLDTVRKFSMLPVIFDAAWYFKRNVGLLYSFYFDYNDFFIFADTRDEEGEYSGHGDTDNLYLLNGLGLSYRTLGRVAAQFNIVLYAGGLRLEANSDLGEFMSEGEKEWFFYMPLSFSPILNINITPNFSIKTKMTMYMSLTTIAGGGGDDKIEGQYSTIFFQYFSLGASVRF
jgi:hypothetical protein